MTNVSWQIEATHRLLKHIENGTTDIAPGPRQIEPRTYSDPDIWATEMDVFRRGPFGVALSCELPGPNTFKKMEVLGVPLLLTRNSDGLAYAFMNVCQHRGATLAVEACGKAKKFTCPYHGWTYANDGRLIAVAEKATFGEVDFESHGLKRLPLEERFGLIFIGLTPGRDLAIDTYLAGLEPYLEAYDLAGRHVIRSDLFDVPNWKLVMEGYVDPYHFAILHRDSLAQFTYGNIVAIDRIGPHSVLSFPAKKIGELKNIPEAKWQPVSEQYISVEIAIFPNISLTLYGTTAILQTVLPGKVPDRSKATQVFAPPVEIVNDSEALAQAEAGAEFIYNVMNGEDYPISWDLQNNSTTGAQSAILFGRNEAAPQYFHEALDQALANNGR